MVNNEARGMSHYSRCHLNSKIKINFANVNFEITLLQIGRVEAGKCDKFQMSKAKVCGNNVHYTN